MSFARRIARPVALTAAAALVLASGCSQAPAAPAEDEAVGTDSAALNAFDWTWTTNNIRPDGQPHTMVVKNVTAGGTYVAVFKDARIDTTTNVDGTQVVAALRWAAVELTYTTSSSTVTAKAAAGAVAVSYPPGAAYVTTVGAGPFSMKVTLEATQLGKGHNQLVRLKDVKIPGTTALLPNALASVDVTASASSVEIVGGPLVGETLTGYYTYSDSSSIAEQDSLYTWWRNDTLVATGSKTYSPTTADVNQDLKFCVDASNSVTSGSSVPRYCSSAMPVPSIVVFSGKKFSGTARAYQTPSSGCIKGAEGDAAGSVVINPTPNGVSDSGVCSAANDLMVSVPSGVYEVTTSLSTIQGASYGLSGVTNTAIEYIQNNAFNKLANNATFGNPGVSTAPILAEVYQYQQAPVIRFVIQGEHMTIAPQ